MAIPSNPKLEGFDIIQTPFKHVGDHGIRADILIPQKPHAGKRPTLVRYHAGGLMMGDSLNMDFWPHWLSDLALKHGAVIISPNYRLMPEATSAEIYKDFEDFWTWLLSPALAELLAAHTTPTELDLDRILTTGESAGGLISVWTALAHPTEIRAALAAYPWVDTDTTAFDEPSSTGGFGRDIPLSVYEDTMASVKLGTPTSSEESAARFGFMLAAIQHGKIYPLLRRGLEESPYRDVLHPMRRLEEPGIRIPRGGIAVIHGRQDSILPAEGVERFVARAREVTQGQPGSDKVILTLRDGDHGFDIPVRVEEQWMQDTFKRAVETWLE
ncbi:hypothetical protein NUU61_000867 [Penicillium alfredii]|uniref:Alpha/beta hydrolase fold-3 domain-containing protein n=1 Tax=Penicillium alfredii TaxID=1506179 RepID=A0A9W9KRG5_9EURO|nr:uncharacterized protein NUU61_000867 [Penicillium alfredii]KAJ5115108.1 hypothetical protein NUU61_000867 [Penicillium alfredii]